MIFDDNVFWILEYARKDSLGRSHSWQGAGIARTQQEVESRSQELQSKFACEIRAHRYSHALGKNA
jgi:hypothetical protein